MEKFPESTGKAFTSHLFVPTRPAPSVLLSPLIPSYDRSEVVPAFGG
eukprot:CAMPEP_0172406304 /NCGR_PEP_ID=MMETSP1061-20121228/70161_1 /TAXON_ID=37318 /ORGANISM="Pseudo-nitzschia pungens, Strain cf. pungens" /LENGTH=46 /DNA_ID= /DNA_START= /DNA_END= /DNA_ORIENTATION=